MLKSAARALLVALTTLALVGTGVTAASAATLSLLDAEVAAEVADVPVEPPSISGDLIDPVPGAPWNIESGGLRTALVYDLDGNRVEPTAMRIGWDAKYEIWGLPAGTYTVQLRLAIGFRSYAYTFVGNQPLRSQATPLTVVDGQTTAAPTVTLANQSLIHGRFFSDATGQDDLSPKTIDVWMLNEVTGEYEYFGTTPEQSFGLSVWGLWAGTYRLRIVPATSSGLAPEWYEDAAYPQQSTPVVVGAGAIVGPVNVSLGPPQAYRLGGVDRYDANVGMSYETFPPSGEPYSIPVLYVASGEKYPDALSAGPAAIANGGGLLLVRYGDIPAVTLEEIERLNPQRIVVVGGPASVSPAVYTQLSGLTGHIERITGSDRYEVSRNLIEQEFACDSAPCLTTVFVATGRNFPDALSAGPAAGHVGGAVLLIDGAQSTLDAPTLALLDDMGVYRAYIAGGPASVTPAVQSHLGSVLDGPVIRFTGADRYEAAANINSTIFGDATTVFISTGQKFADALAGGPLAGSYDGPLYLAPGTCMPESVADSIVDRNPAELVLLGGPASISDDVLYWLC